MNTKDKPALQNFHISGVKHISPENALEELETNHSIMVDVREADEVILENIPLPNVLNHAMSVIMDRLQKIPKDYNIIVACPGGVRSSKVANLLNIAGFPTVANLDGGFNVWKAKGLPYESVLPGNDGFGCDCSSCGENSGDSCC